MLAQPRMTDQQWMLAQPRMTDQQWMLAQSRMITVWYEYLREVALVVWPEENGVGVELRYREIESRRNYKRGRTE